MICHCLDTNEVIAAMVVILFVAFIAYAVYKS